MQPVSLLFCALVLVLGCGSSAEFSSGEVRPGKAQPAAGEDGAADPGGDRAIDLAAAERKIIYEAVVKLVVGDFSRTEADIPKLVNQFEGYLAEASVDRTRGDRRSGRWVARIPVEHYEAFLEAVSELGVPEMRNQTAQDVTEEYLDLEARIGNQRRLEQRILDLLQDPKGEIKDVIEVERELARVRGEIERMEGRLKYLANRTALTTVTIHVREQRDYKPPQAPTFAARIGFAWESSLTALRSFAEDLTVFAVFASPWLMIMLVVAAPPAWFLRRHWKRKPAAPIFSQSKSAPRGPRTPPADDE